MIENTAPKNNANKRIAGFCCTQSTYFEDDIDNNLSTEGTTPSSENIAVIREEWGNRIEFLLSCIGFAVGLGNIWRFPIKVYYGGGGAFLIPYTIICILLGIPLIILEMGLGQFSGRSPVKAFKFVPVLYGLGWCMFIINVIIVIYYSVIMAWSYIYLFGSLRTVMDWTVCTHKFNSPQCLGSNIKSSSLNSSFIYVSSTSEYWDYYVTGFIKYPSRELYSMNENPSAPQWHITLCLLLVWIVAANALMFGIKVSGKIIYFLVLFPYVALFGLILLSSTLPGAGYGIKFYLFPNFNKMLDPLILRSAVEQLFFSSSLAFGGMITFASYNKFNDNIFRDAIIVIFADSVTSILGGFAVFPILGYMAYRNNLPIENVITSGPGLFFITYTEALATMPWANLLTFIFMLMAINLGMSSQFAITETIITGLVDVFPSIRKNRYTKIICVWIICLFCFLCGILLCTPGGLYYFNIMDLKLSSYGLLILALLEAICVGWIYGIKQFRYDYKMMLGFNISWYWFIAMAYVCPIIITAILIASIINNDRIQVHGETIPQWGENFGYFVLMFIFSPLVICAIHTIIKYKMKYPKIKGILFLKKLFKPPIYWGPLYLRNWNLASFYRKKFETYRNDPNFSNNIIGRQNQPSININDTEDINLQDVELVNVCDT